MSKLPSDATRLRLLKSAFNQLRKDFDATCEHRDQYRARATKAEQAAKEWQERFDILLRREESK